MKEKCDENISFGTGEWSFGNKSLVDDFDRHISSSVPLYKEAQIETIALSNFFLKSDSVVCDIGTTTGSFLVRLCEHYKEKHNLNVYGYEIETHFAEHAKSKLNPYLDEHYIEIITENILDSILPKSNFITSFYTLQFISPSVRHLVFKKIYESLNWGGAFILFEKVRGVDARFQDIFTSNLYQYKMRQGFSPDEVLNKSLSLNGILEPFSDTGNRNMLSIAGFKDVDIFMRYINFQGYICIK